MTDSNKTHYDNLLSEKKISKEQLPASIENGCVVVADDVSTEHLTRLIQNAQSS